MDGLALRPTLHITEEDDRTATTRLVLHGELDCSSAPQLRARIRDTLTGGTTTLILDLARISFLDAAGLGVLVGAHRKLEERGGRLEVCRTPRSVQRVLEVTGLHDLLQPTAAPDDDPIAAPSSDLSNAGPS